MDRSSQHHGMSQSCCSPSLASAKTSFVTRIPSPQSSRFKSRLCMTTLVLIQTVIGSSAAPTDCVAMCDHFVGGDGLPVEVDELQPAVDAGAITILGDSLNFGFANGFAHSAPVNVQFIGIILSHTVPILITFQLLASPSGQDKRAARVG